MNTITKLAIALALLLGSAVAGAQSVTTQSVTFDFTGSIADATYADAANAVLIPDGNLVTGSFTFTYAPLLSNNTTNVFGTIGTSSPGGWLAESAGFGPGTMLFSSTVQVVGFSTSYVSGDSGGVSSSLIRGGSTTGIAGNPCGGNDDGISQGAGGLGGCESSGSGLVGSESWITLNAAFGSVVFGSNGLPDTASLGGSGEFLFYTNGPSTSIFGGAHGVEFGIDSVTLAPGSTLAFAPEIDANSAVAGVTLLLGGLLVLRGRRVVKMDNSAAA